MRNGIKSNINDRNNEITNQMKASIFENAHSHSVEKWIFVCDFVPSFDIPKWKKRRNNLFSICILPSCFYFRYFDAQTRRTQNVVDRRLLLEMKTVCSVSYAYNLSVMHIRRVGVRFFIARFALFFFWREFDDDDDDNGFNEQWYFVAKRIVYIVSSGAFHFNYRFYEYTHKHPKWARVTENPFTLEAKCCSLHELQFCCVEFSSFQFHEFTTKRIMPFSWRPTSNKALNWNLGMVQAFTFLCTFSFLHVLKTEQQQPKKKL